MGMCYRDLQVWKDSIDLVELVYQETLSFPKSETYGLISQMRRSAVSVPSNIAEGQGRRSPKEFCQFLRHARGSLSELETQVVICIRLGYLIPEKGESILRVSSSVGRMLNGLMDSQLQKIT